MAADKTSQQQQPVDELDELIDFLGDSRPQIKQHAAELVQGLTGSPEGIAQLASRASRLLPALLRLVGAEAATSGPALAALVNLSQEPAVQAQLLEAGAVGRCMDYVRERGCAHPGRLIMLLANLTSAEEGAAALLQLGKERLEGLWVAMLLRLFLTPAAGSGASGASDADPYEHVATVLPNVTRFREGRRLLLQPGRGLLRALASQLRAPNERRRRGCAGALKNCCFSAEEDGTLEHIVAEKEALRTVLDVLCGVSAKEDDAVVRENLAEAVLCMARPERGRKALWACKAPELLQKGYEWEESPTVCAAMEATAELFLADGFQPAQADSEAAQAGAEAAPAAAGGQGSRRDVQIEEID
eukprot:scaffold11.g4078.t1